MIRSAVVTILLLGTVLFAAPAAQRDESEKLLRLSLDVMLYNRDLPHALQIAQKGLARHPSDPWWLGKSAQIALWLGKTDLAKAYYLQLYRITREANIASDLSRLVAATHDKESEIALLKAQLTNRYRPELVGKLYRAFYDMGSLEKGAAYFKKLCRDHPDRSVAAAALRLEMAYAPFAEISREYRVFRRKYGTDKDLLYRYTKLLFARKAYREAFIMLDAAHSRFDASDGALWKLYADLAIVLGNSHALYAILDHIYRLAPLTDEEAHYYLRMLEKYAPQKALRFAHSRYLEAPSARRFYTFAYEATRLKRADLLAEVLDKMPLPIKKALSEESRYYEIEAWLYREKGAARQVIGSYQKAIRLDPHNLSLYEAYLWALIDYHRSHLLQKTLRKLRRYDRSAMTLPRALGYMMLGNSAAAEPFVRRLVQTTPRNWQYNLLYADLLAQKGDRTQEAFYRRRAWQLARHASRSGRSHQMDRSGWYDYLRLALRFDPIHRDRWLQIARERLSRKQLVDLYLASADPIMERSRIVALLQHQKAAHTPAKALRLALLQDDRERLSELLESGKPLPTLDKIAAMQKTGDLRGARSLCFAAMQKNPENGDLLRTYTEMVTQRTRYSLIAAREQRGKIDMRTLKLTARPDPVSPHAPQLTVETKALRHDSKIFLTKSAALQTETEWANMHLRIEAGILRKARTHGFANISGSYRRGRHTLTAEATRHADDDTTNDLLLHGYHDSMQIGERYDIDTHRALSMGWSRYRYFDENGTLGTSDLLQVDYTRYLRLGYPDLLWQLFGSWQRFSDRSARLPDNYWQSGIRLSTGERMREAFHHRLRPYASATLLYNNRTETGYALRAGASGALLGHDALGLELYYSSGLGIRQEDYLSLRMRYLYW